MKSKHYQLIIFDWEGTLSDTLGQILNCVATQAAQLNYGVLDEKLARQSIDLGLVNAIKRVFAYLTVQQQNHLIDAVQQEMMLRHGETYLFPGAKEIISRIHRAKIELAIATNKGHQSLQRAMSTSGLTDYFQTTRSASQTVPKPDPTMLEQILYELAVPVEDSLMIGDSIVDMEMAQSIKMDAVGVNFYHLDTIGLLNAGALAVFDDYTQVADFLQLP